MVLDLILPSAIQDVHEKTLKSHSGFFSAIAVVPLYYGSIYQI